MGRLAERVVCSLAVAVALCASLAPSCAAQQSGRDAAQSDESPSLVFGLFLASVEEGGRMMTPSRLLPFEHPEALGHEFPNPGQMHASEVEALVAMGEHTGLGLRATLLRYPRPPAQRWPYREFSPPPAQAIVACSTIRHYPRDASPAPGLRAVAKVSGKPAAFIVDTRGLSLAERGMTRPTTGGIDYDRATLLRAMEAACALVEDAEDAVILFDLPRQDPHTGAAAPGLRRAVRQALRRPASSAASAAGSAPSR